MRSDTGKVSTKMGARGQEEKKGLFDCFMLLNFPEEKHKVHWTLWEW